MEIVKSSISIIQGVGFSTIKDLEDYVVVSYPIDCHIEIKDKFIHIRKKKQGEKLEDTQ